MFDQLIRTFFIDVFRIYGSQLCIKFMSFYWVDKRETFQGYWNLHSVLCTPLRPIYLEAVGTTGKNDGWLHYWFFRLWSVCPGSL